MHDLSAGMYNAGTLGTLLIASAVNWGYRQDCIKQALLKNYISVVVGEVIVNWAIAAYALNIHDYTVRWLLLCTITVAFRNILKLYIEAVKEKSMEGSNFAASIALSEDMGHAVGLIIAIAMGYFDYWVMPVDTASVVMSAVNMLEAVLIIRVVREVGVPQST